MGFLDGLGNSLINGVLGIGIGSINAGNQMSRQNELYSMQNKYSKELFDYQQNKQFEMLNKTSYKWQVEKMREAGLNPALLYGQSGGGGATTGGSMPNAGATQAPLINTMELGVNMAQVELLKAQARKVNEEADQLGGIDKNIKEANLGSIIAGTKNQYLQGKLIGMQTDGNRLDNALKEKNFDNAVKMYEKQVEQMDYMIDLIKNQRDISDATKEEQIAVIKSNVDEQKARIDLMKSNNDLNIEQAKKIVQDVKNSIRSLNQKDKEIVIAYKNYLVNQMNAESNKLNASTRLTDVMYNQQNTRDRINLEGRSVSVAEAAQKLQEFIRDVPDSTKLTVESLTSILNTVISKSMPTTSYSHVIK